MSNQDLVITTDGLSHFKAKQDLENENKFKKKDDATDLKGAVRYDAAQVLSEQEKAQARANIGAAAPGEGGGGSAEGAVLYTEQALTAEQQSQARANIGATDGTWESMPDKPFGEAGVALEWDGTITDADRKIDIENAGVSFYRVSDDVVEEHNLIGATCKTYEEHINEFTVTAEMIHRFDTGSFAVMKDDAPVIISVTAAETIAFGEASVFFPSKGVWFFSFNNGSVYTTAIVTNGSIKKIDEKYLPDSVVKTDENGLIPTSMLPSYVDDVIEGYYNAEDNLFYKEAEFTTAITGETGKIYTDLASRDIYRWSGSVFVQINPKTYRIATNDEIDALFSK